MARGLVLQSNFSAGVLDPRLAARVDTEQYKRGAKTLDNVQALPMGGVKRRPGTRHIADLTSDVAAGSRLASFEFSETQNYLVVFASTKLLIYRASAFDATRTADTLVQTITGAPWGAADLPDIDFTQSVDTMIIVHPDYQPYKLTRSEGETGAGPTFVLAALTLSNIPQYAYGDSSSPTAINEKQILRFTDFRQGDLFKIMVDGEVYPSGTHDWNTYDKDHGDFLTVIQDALDTFSGYTTTVTELTSTMTGFNAAGAQGEDFDISMVVEFTEPANTAVPTISLRLHGDVEGEFVAGEWYKGGELVEDVWSATRGWPRSCTFHENRLWLGGSKSRPATLWGSRIGEYFDFEVGDGLDDDSISVTLDTDRINEIQYVVSARNLEIFTTGGEFQIPNPPITPASIQIPRQSSYGSARVRPANIDGATLFIDKQKRGVRQYLFSFEEDGYTAAEISIMAAHIISSPVDMTAQKDADGDYAYVVNSDGTMAILNTHRFQGVSSWTRYTTRTGDTFERVASVNDRVYVIAKRSVGSAKYFLERFDASTYTDAAEILTSASPTSTWTGSVLVGETVKVRSGDTEILQIVDSAGTATNQALTASFLTDLDATSLEVGVNFDLTVEPMPPSVDFGLGQSLVRKSRIARATVLLRNSADVYVDGYRVGDHMEWDAIAGDADPSSSGYTTSPVLLNGPQEIRMLGYSEQPTVKITQAEPMPLTLLGVEIELIGSS